MAIHRRHRRLLGYTPPEGVWVTAVVRKATGTTTPRLSWYNHSTKAWTHANAGATTANGTAPGASGSSTPPPTAPTAKPGKATSPSPPPGPTRLKWSADATGDAQIIDAGLHLSLNAWIAAAPSGLWVWDQSATAQIVGDRAGGGAGQSAISGTTVSTLSLPDLGYGAPTIQLRRQPAAAGGVARDLDATSDAVAEHGADIVRARTVDATSDAVAEHTAALARDRPIAATSDAVAEHEGDLTTRSPPPPPAPCSRPPGPPPTNHRGWMKYG